MMFTDTIVSLAWVCYGQEYDGYLTGAAAYVGKRPRLCRALTPLGNVLYRIGCALA